MIWSLLPVLASQGHEVSQSSSRIGRIGDEGRGKKRYVLDLLESRVNVLGKYRIA